MFMGEDLIVSLCDQLLSFILLWKTPNAALLSKKAPPLFASRYIVNVTVNFVVLVIGLDSIHLYVTSPPTIWAADNVVWYKNVIIMKVKIRDTANEFVLTKIVFYSKYD